MASEKWEHPRVVVANDQLPVANENFEISMASGQWEDPRVVVANDQLPVANENFNH